MNVFRKNRINSLGIMCSTHRITKQIKNKDTVTFTLKRLSPKSQLIKKLKQKNR